MTAPVLQGATATRYVPDAVTIILGLCLLTVLVSVLAEAIGASVTLPDGTAVAAESLLSAHNLERILVDMPDTFSSFAPLGMVLVVMLGAGLAEKVGLFDAALSGALHRLPRRALIPMTVVIGICAHVTVDASYFVFIPLAGVAFRAAGRSAFTGVCAAFAGVSGGYGANILVTPTDAVLYGLSEEAARALDPSIQIDLLANYYLLLAYAVIVTFIVTVVTERLVEPRFRPEDDEHHEPEFRLEPQLARRGLRWSGAAALLVLVLVLVLTVPGGAPLRAESGDLAPFYEALIALITVFFLATGLAYGVATGRLRNDTDLMELLRASMRDVAPFLVLVFFAAHFAAFLRWSNLAVIAATSGADFLRSSNISGIPLVVGFTFISGLLNLLMASASGKWALMAPTIVPMLMSAGLSPELVTAAYRIGDSATNIITPTSLLPVVLIYAQKYRPDIGLGAFIRIMLPYSVAMFVAGLLLLVTWLALGLPLGPSGAEPYLTSTSGALPIL
ncbi:MAG: AbgT family transporter [Haliea sp.]|uniref:AbgT family transporter n=1 Tax=Marinobacter salarius TaxID=1420917 RepID=UPI0032EBFD43